MSQLSAQLGSEHSLTSTAAVQNTAQLQQSNINVFAIAIAFCKSQVHFLASCLRYGAQSVLQLTAGKRCRDTEGLMFCSVLVPDNWHHRCHHERNSSLSLRMPFDAAVFAPVPRSDTCCQLSFYNSAFNMSTGILSDVHSWRTAAHAIPMNPYDSHELCSQVFSCDLGDI